MPPIHFWGNSSSISNQFLAYSDNEVSKPTGTYYIPISNPVLDLIYVILESASSQALPSESLPVISLAQGLGVIARLIGRKKILRLTN